MAEALTIWEEMIARILLLAPERSDFLMKLMECFRYTSIALIVSSCAATVVFVIIIGSLYLNRLHEDEMHEDDSVQDLYLLQKQKNVTAFSNPFVTKLVSTSSSNLTDGIWVEISCLKPCEVHIYWGARIDYVHSTLLRLGRNLVNNIHNKELFTGQCLAIDAQNIESAGKLCLHFPKPQCVSAEDLGPVPRQRYPCVVVVSVPDTGWINNYTDVVASFTLVHLADSKCSLKTHIIEEYVKMAEKAVFRLQPMFLSSFGDEDINVSNNDPSNEQLVSSAEDEGASQAASPAIASPHESHEDLSFKSVPIPDCIICQSEALNCVFLPCRHACVCSLCFLKLWRRCPMCRSFIDSYFLIEETWNLAPVEGEDEDRTNTIFSRFVTLINARLNDFFGV